MPEISSINCNQEMNGMCELKGESIDYISQVSIDGGQSWYPQSPTTLQVQPTQDGQKLGMIPMLPNKKLLMIKLRDFSKGEGLFINNFTFSNSVKGSNKAGMGSGQGQMLNRNPNNFPTQPNPNNQPVPNKPSVNNQVKK